MTIKRYQPRETPYTEMFLQADGEYVRYGDYAAAIAHNEYLLARLKKLDAQMEAIGAGGVSPLMGRRKQSDVARNDSP